MSQTAFKAFSLEDDAFITGGLLQDVDVEITSLQYTAWDYGQSGVVSEDVLAVKIMLQQLGEDGKPVTDAEGKPEPAHEQYWSCGGKFADVVVSDDGLMAGPTPGKSALTKGSNFHLFLQSLRAKGMPKGYLEDGNIGKLQGTKFHLIRTPAPKREGLSGGSRRSDREQTIAMCGSIIWGPWDGKGARKPTAASKANGAAAGSTSSTSSSPAPAGDVDAKAKELVHAYLSTQKDQTAESMSALKVAVFREATKDRTIAADKRNAIAKLCENAAWLEANGCALMDNSVMLLP